MKIINLISGPGAGKSTLASGLFHEMKKMRLSVEWVNEYAKDLTWENRHNVLADQLYVTAKQNRRFMRLQAHDVDYVVTDTCLLLGLIYQTKDYYKSFPDLLLEVFNSYENEIFFLERSVDYDPTGRNQTYDEALAIDEQCKDVLNQLNVPFHLISSSSSTGAIEEILKILNLS